MEKKEIYVVAFEWCDDGEINTTIMPKAFTNIAKANEYAHETFRAARDNQPYKKYHDAELEILEDELYCKIPSDNYYFMVHVETVSLEE